MLKRVVALLLALAGLAEHAAGRSPPVRWLVLWSLRQAYAVASDFVAASRPIAGGQSSPDLIAARYGPADAMNLAVSLRSLALTVANMAAQLRRAFLQRSQASDETCFAGRTHHCVLHCFLDAAFSSVGRRDTS